jgi:hypothetical protein
MLHLGADTACGDLLYDYIKISLDLQSLSAYVAYTFSTMTRHIPLGLTEWDSIVADIDREIANIDRPIVRDNTARYSIQIALQVAKLVDSLLSICFYTMSIKSLS